MRSNTFQPGMGVSAQPFDPQQQMMSQRLASQQQPKKSPDMPPNMTYQDLQNMNLAQHQFQQEKNNQQKVANSIVNHNTLLKNVKQATQNVMSAQTQKPVHDNSNLTAENVQGIQTTHTFAQGVIPNQIVLQPTDNLSNSGLSSINVGHSSNADSLSVDDNNTDTVSVDGTATSLTNARTTVDEVQQELKKQIENIVSNQITLEIEKMETVEKHSLLDEIQRKILKETTSFSTQRILEATGGESIQDDPMVMGGNVTQQSSMFQPTDEMF
jgi:hypothetical protein